MALDAEQLAFLAGPDGRRLLALPLPGDPLAAAERLRKHCAPDQAAAVATTRALRRRAEAGRRFPPELARELLATDKLLQQASSMRLAAYKGRQLAQLAAGRTVLDLCCGLGADTIGLALAGATVCGYDRSREAIVCAAHNAAVAGVADRCTFAAADVTALEVPPDAVVYADPDRRPDGRRTVHLADYQPGEAFLRALPGRTAAGAMKLSPALDTSELGPMPGVTREYLSEDGVCKQLVLWWPSPGTDDEPVPSCRATVVFGEMLDPQSESIPAGLAPPAPLDEPGEWLIEPDPAVIAAGAVDDLAAREGLWRIDARLAWLFGRGPVAGALARNFRILRSVPGRERDVARAVAELGGGTVEVKPRGLQLDTDRMQRRIRGRGRRPLAVLWCRLGSRHRAFVCQRQ